MFTTRDSRKALPSAGFPRREQLTRPTQTHEISFSKHDSPKSKNLYLKPPSRAPLGMDPVSSEETRTGRSSARRRPVLREEVGPVRRIRQGWMRAETYHPVVDGPRGRPVPGPRQPSRARPAHLPMMLIRVLSPLE